MSIETETYASGGHGTRTHNPLRGTTFPVCLRLDVKLWDVGRYDMRSHWGAESGDVELASVRTSLHESHSTTLHYSLPFFSS